MRALLDESGVKARPAEVDLDLDIELEPGCSTRTWTSPPAGATRDRLQPGDRCRALRAACAGRRGRGFRAARTRAADLTREFTLEFAPEELVVHVDHGIARFKGMRLIESEGAHREYLELEYAEGDKLFVPVESLDRVQKYLGGEGAPALHRLGTADWTRARGRARKVVQDVAEDLLKIYALREARPGIAFAPDTAWQHELEASFPYEETPDQVAALAEIKADMESDRPMDRLLCGDVGFGKTELAMRAAFKAVDERQAGGRARADDRARAAALPRFPRAPGRIPGRASRCCRDSSTTRRRSETVEGLEERPGRHRHRHAPPAQQDVRFKRLGLLVIDEEQRFGVDAEGAPEAAAHAAGRADAVGDADPAHAAHGARRHPRHERRSQTPPEERQPIKTYVTAYDDELIREAITRELQRGGQVYFVHNRVHNDRRRRPSACASSSPRRGSSIGHGQMARGRAREGDGRLRVRQARRARLHDDHRVRPRHPQRQHDHHRPRRPLRPRAALPAARPRRAAPSAARTPTSCTTHGGRSPSRRTSASTSSRGCTSSAPGFKIACATWRSAAPATCWAPSSTAQIAAVGFEMYLQMLQSAVNKLRSGSDETAVADVLSTAEMNLDLPLDHFIPRSYIRDEKLRLGAYRQLAGTEDEAELDSVLRSLKDRYGHAPAQLDNLAYSLRIKLRGQQMGLRGVVADGNDIVVRVDPQRLIDVDELARRMAGRISVGPNRIKMRRKGGGLAGRPADAARRDGRALRGRAWRRAGGFVKTTIRRNEKPSVHGIAAIFEVVHTLRAPGGCPWDREQTHESLRPYLLEETYELLEAIDAGDDAKMMEELGDLLLQVAMHAEIAAEEGRFDAAEVSEAAAAKMVKRHPHVFGDKSVADADEVLRNWEHQKMREAREAGSDDSVVDRVPASLPALAWTLGLQKRAARVGFDFASPAAAAGSVGEEARELAEVTDRDRAFEEMGDLLFAIVSLARSMKINPEDSLRVAGQRFRKRFAAVESTLRSEGKTFTDLTPAEMLARWEETR